MSVNLTDCVFQENMATLDGGAVESYFGSPVMTNCLFYDNLSATGDGGAIKNYKGSPLIINCTVADNGATGLLSGYPEIHACVFARNEIGIISATMRSVCHGWGFKE